jgi:hypothetical protein
MKLEIKPCLVPAHVQKLDESLLNYIELSANRISVDKEIYGAARNIGCILHLNDGWRYFHGANNLSLTGEECLEIGQKINSLNQERKSLEFRETSFGFEVYMHSLKYGEIRHKLAHNGRSRCYQYIGNGFGPQNQVGLQEEQLKLIFNKISELNKNVSNESV